MPRTTPSPLNKYRLPIASIFLLVGTVLPAQPIRAAVAPSLVSSYEDEIPNLVESFKTWHPFPREDERDAWEALPSEIRKELISDAELFLKQEWPQLPATLFLEFFRSGNKRAYEEVNEHRRDRLRRLVLAECAEGKGRFLDDIINGIWTMCEQSYWGNSATTFLQAPFHDQVELNSLRRLAEIRTFLPDVKKPGVDLRTGEFVSLLGWTLYLLGPKLDAVTPLIRERIYDEADRRMLTPCLEREFIWMQGGGNWTTWISSNWLTAIFLLEREDSRKSEGLKKLFGTLDQFFSKDQPDGACHEGPSYWRKTAGSLCESLELLHSASNGEIDFFDKQLIKNMAQYIYKVHIADNYFMNFSDSPGKIDMPAELMIRFGQRINDSNLEALGRSLLVHPRSWREHSLQRDLAALFLTPLEPYQGTSMAAALIRDSWISSMQVMSARDKAGTTQGFFLGAKAGNNGEGHNHNDTGNFVLFGDGKPVLIDVGPIAYTATNSSPDRYSIWTMQSAYHNLPTINGIMQQEGRRYAALDVFYDSGETFATLSMDLAGAYPAEAGLTSWMRTLTLNRGQDVTLKERFVLQHKVSEIRLSLMTPCDVRELASGALELRSPGMPDSVRVMYDGDKLKTTLEIIPITDKGLQSVWGSQITRIQLTDTTLEEENEWHIRFVLQRRIN